MWIDADDGLRSKCKVLYDKKCKTIGDCPVWNFDGSSTKQAEGNFSDVFLKPIRMYDDPFRKDIPNSKLVLCECYDDFKCTKKNATNYREALEKV